jgi:hypothetical protein
LSDNSVINRVLDDILESNDTSDESIAVASEGDCFEMMIMMRLLLMRMSGARPGRHRRVQRYYN